MAVDVANAGAQYFYSHDAALVLIRSYGATAPWFDLDAFQASLAERLPAESKIIPYDARFIDSETADMRRDMVTALGFAGIIHVELHPAQDRVDASVSTWLIGEDGFTAPEMLFFDAPPPPPEPEPEPEWAGWTAPSAYPEVPVVPSPLPPAPAQPERSSTSLGLLGGGVASALLGGAGIAYGAVTYASYTSAPATADPDDMDRLYATNRVSAIGGYALVGTGGVLILSSVATRKR